MEKRWIKNPGSIPREQTLPKEKLGGATGEGVCPIVQVEMAVTTFVLQRKSPGSK